VLDDEEARGLFITGTIARAARKAIVENVRVLDGMGLARASPNVRSCARCSTRVTR
jgi:hypothetical protein